MIKLIEALRSLNDSRAYLTSGGVSPHGALASLPGPDSGPRPPQLPREFHTLVQLEVPMALRYCDCPEAAVWMRSSLRVSDC